MIEELKKIYPDIESMIISGDIVIQDDSDGYGEYISKWNVDYCLPEGMKVGKEEK